MEKESRADSTAAEKNPGFANRGLDLTRKNISKLI